MRIKTGKTLISIITGTHTHRVQKLASTHRLTRPHRCAGTRWRIQSQHTSAGLFFMGCRENEQLFTLHVLWARSRSVSLSASLYHPSIWMTKLVLLKYKAQSLCLLHHLFFLSSSSPYFSSTSSLTCSDTAGFLQTFRFSLFAFWWGDTRHIVESSHPGGILIEENHEWVSQGHREWLKQCRETGWDKGEVKMRDCHQKK